MRENIEENILLYAKIVVIQLRFCDFLPGKISIVERGIFGWGSFIKDVIDWA